MQPPAPRLTSKIEVRSEQRNQTIRRLDSQIVILDMAFFNHSDANWFPKSASSLQVPGSDIDH